MGILVMVRPRSSTPTTAMNRRMLGSRFCLTSRPHRRRPARRFASANPAMQRAINRSLVLQQLHRQQRVSRSKLAALTGLNKATVTAVVQELLGASLVAEVGSHQGAVGRPAVQLEFHPTAHLIS